MTRYYSSSAGKMVLQLGVTAVATALQVDTTAGLPGQTPFTLLVDVGQPTEEIVTVTAVSGNTLTVTRGEDGASAQPHTNGAVVRHAITARDLREARDHEGATSGVHGVISDVVGLSDTQALSHKDMTSATNTFPTTLATAANLTTHTGAAAAHGATGAVVGTTNAQTLTNKTITGGTVNPDTLQKAGVDAVTVSDTQTLTGKAISGATNTLTAIAEASVTGLVADLAATVKGTTSFGANRMHRQDYVSATTDGSGFLVVTHAAGFTPSACIAMSRNPSGTWALFHGADTFAATTTRLRFMHASTAGPYASALTGAFTVIFFE